MFSLDSLPEAATGVAKVYDRAGIIQFLELAEGERVRLEAALAVVQERRKAAEAALTAAAERSLRSVASLRAVTRDLAAERDTTQRTIAVILAAAEAEAEAIIADARDQAAAILARLPDQRPTASAPPIAEERLLGEQLVG